MMDEKQPYPLHDRWWFEFRDESVLFVNSLPKEWYEILNKYKDSHRFVTFPDGIQAISWEHRYEAINAVRRQCYALIGEFSKNKTQLENV
jgi:hypothetical protein